MNTGPKGRVNKPLKVFINLKLACRQDNGLAGGLVKASKLKIKTTKTKGWPDRQTNQKKKKKVAG